MLKRTQSTAPARERHEFVRLAGLKK